MNDGAAHAEGPASEKPIQGNRAGGTYAGAALSTYADRLAARHLKAGDVQRPSNASIGDERNGYKWDQSVAVDPLRHYPSGIPARRMPSWMRSTPARKAGLSLDLARARKRRIADNLRSTRTGRSCTIGPPQIQWTVYSTTDQTAAPNERDTTGCPFRPTC
jgi:hypothetical protein